MVICFVKQKTAYEMRISDWSSDVCSSDLGCTRDGGYATHAVADAHFCFHIPASYADEEAAPLLCAGLIGWRSLRAAGDGRGIGLYGFGAAAQDRKSVV